MSAKEDMIRRAQAASARTSERLAGREKDAPDFTSEETKRIKAEDRAAGRCFVCRGEGHFARDCPNDPDRARAVRKGEVSAVRRALIEQAEALRPDSDEEDTAESKTENTVPRRVGRVQVQADELDAQEVDDEVTVRHVHGDLPGTRFRSAPSCKLSVWVEGSGVRYDICPDSGADLSTISEKTLAAIAPTPSVCLLRKLESEATRETRPRCPPRSSDWTSTSARRKAPTLPGRLRMSTE
ncbi:hypothetical protein V8E36_006698 [Tilletia maclaganii]